MLKEASMNISMTGNTSSEVLELMAILKNAGLDTAHLVTDMDINQPMPDEGDHMCPACAAAHSMDTPCGEAVEEEYANSPDEEYQDDSYMLQDLSGGLNRKKDKGALRAKDPAITYEQKLKAQLKKNLYEKYEKLDEFGLDDLRSGWNKAKDTVSQGWNKAKDTVSQAWNNGGDDTQQQTTKKNQTTDNSTTKKNTSRSDFEASKKASKDKFNASRKASNDKMIASYERMVAKYKNQPEDSRYQEQIGNRTYDFTRDQYIDYLEQTIEYHKQHGEGPMFKSPELADNAIKNKPEGKGSEDAKKQDQTQAQKVSATDDNAQQSSAQQTAPEEPAAPEPAAPEPPAEEPAAPEPAAPEPAAPEPAAPEPPAEEPAAPEPAAGQAAPEPAAGQANPQAGPPPTPDSNQQAPAGQAAPEPAAGQAAPKAPPKAPAGGQPRPKNVSQARQQARLRATKAAPKAPAGQAGAPERQPYQGLAQRRAAAQGSTAQQQQTRTQPQQRAAQNAPQVNPKVQNASKQLVDYLKSQGFDAKSVQSFFASLF
jgi:hypothetical protein